MYPSPSKDLKEVIGLNEVLDAVQEFHKLWFPDLEQPDGIQSFWFGARRPRDRKLFKVLQQKLILGERGSTP